MSFSALVLCRACAGTRRLSLEVMYPAAGMAYSMSGLSAWSWMMSPAQATQAAMSPLLRSAV